MQLILKLAILLTMMNDDYHAYAEKFNRQLVVVSGLIIYDYTAPIPQSVVMIPCTPRPGQDLASLAKEQLVQCQTEGMFLYFQSIRWTMPNVEESLNDWTFINAKGIDGYFHNFPLRIGYGKITCDNSDADSEEEDDKVREFVLNVLDTVVKIKVTELPKAVGPAKTFEKVNL